MQKVNVASIPRAQKILGRASCLSSDAAGDCIKVVGPKVGPLYAVEKFDPASPGLTQSVGVITKKYSSELCRVQFHGLMIDVYTSLIPGRRYWVGTDSRLTDTKPVPGVGSSLYLQLMGIALAENELMLDPHMPIVLNR